MSTSNLVQVDRGGNGAAPNGTKGTKGPKETKGQIDGEQLEASECGTLTGAACGY